MVDKNYHTLKGENRVSKKNKEVEIMESIKNNQKMI